MRAAHPRATRAGARTSSGHITWSTTDDGGMWCNPWGIWWDEVQRVRHPAPRRRRRRSSRATGTSRRAVFLHTELHRAAPDAAVIVHNHPYYATLLVDDGRAAADGAPELVHLRRRARVRRRVRRRRGRERRASGSPTQVGDASGHPARAPRRDRHRADDRGGVLQGRRRSSACAASPTTSSPPDARPCEMPADAARAAASRCCDRTRRRRTGTARCACCSRDEPEVLQ